MWHLKSIISINIIQCETDKIKANDFYAHMGLVPNSHSSFFNINWTI